MLYHLDNICKTFRPPKKEKKRLEHSVIPALSNINLTIHEGEMIGLVGPNGSGKSTLCNILTGILKPSSGRVYFRGKEVTDSTHLKEVAISMPNGIGLIPDMKARQYLTYKAKIYDKKFDESNNFIDLLQVRQLLDKKITSCSSGEMQRINILGTIIADAPVSILDEPTASLDIFTKYIFLEAIDQLRSLGRTVILISHHTDEIIKMDRLIMLYKGKVHFDGKMQSREEVDDKLMNLCKMHYSREVV